ncbi:hypothetical protein [Actinopolymorpha sp. B9G3]|uniref:hypothetical protein n=1 Tax=Actinopolymorpha sp. B9G3 TaxID=3158970 RepID=UPI0032D9575F
MLRSFSQPAVGRAHRRRLGELQAALEAHQAYWHPSPFHVRRPDWCVARPELADAVLGIDSLTVETLSHDPDACRDWLTPWLPVVDTLGRLVNLPPLPVRDLPAMPPRLDRRIRGRKRDQIEAFAAHAPPAQGPLLEWCAGKGHLGRRLAIADRVPVQSLEIDPKLCADATQLAERAGIDQTVLCADALDDDSHACVKAVRYSPCMPAANCTALSYAVRHALAPTATSLPRAATTAGLLTPIVRSPATPRCLLTPTSSGWP